MINARKVLTVYSDQEAGEAVVVFSADFERSECDTHILDVLNDCIVEIRNLRDEVHDRLYPKEQGK